MPRVKLFNEEDILQKAIELFWKQGYSATSMQNLVDYLGINRASLYNTFGGKKELFEKAFKAYKEVNTKTIIEFLDNQTSVKEGLLNFFELPINASIHNGEARGCFIVNTTTELALEDAEINSILIENKKNLEKLFFNFLKKGISDGQLNSDKNIKSIAAFLFMLLNGIMVVAKVNPNKKYLLSIVRTSLEILD